MPIDLGKLKERIEKKVAERGDRYTIKDGDNYLRVLPPSLEYFTENVDYICYEYLIHYNIGPDDNRIALICPKTLGKQHKCPICEATFKLYRTNTLEDKTLANSIRAKRRHIYNIIDLEDLEKGVQVLETGPDIYDKLVVFITNKKWGDLLDLDKGRNITITKTPGKETSSGYNEYALTPDPDVTSGRSKLPKNYKEQISMLARLVPVAKSYDEMKAILEGEEIGEVSISKVKEQKHIEEEVVEDKEDSGGNISKKPKQSTTVKEETPKCFGVDYGPRRDQCIECSQKIACREEYLKVDV